jgi:phage-related protein
MPDEPPLKRVVWVGSSRKDLRALPGAVQDHVGYALNLAHRGGRHRDAKTLKGYSGAGVVESSGTTAAIPSGRVYTVQLAGTVYVLHVFQKKSKKGRATPKVDLKLIEQRLREAERIAKGRDA